MTVPARVGPGSAGRVRNVSERCTDGQPGHPLREVEVVQYRCNYSAFSGYCWTPSDYSGLRCSACGTFWRTKAAYVEALR